MASTNSGHNSGISSGTQIGSFTLCVSVAVKTAGAVPRMVGEGIGAGEGLLLQRSLAGTNVRSCETTETTERDRRPEGVAFAGISTPPPWKSRIRRGAPLSNARRRRIFPDVSLSSHANPTKTPGNQPSRQQPNGGFLPVAVVG